MCAGRAPLYQNVACTGIFSVTFSNPNGIAPGLGGQTVIGHKLSNMRESGSRSLLRKLEGSARPLARLPVGTFPSTMMFDQRCIMPARCACRMVKLGGTQPNLLSA